MDERRQFPRYNVADFPELSGWLEKNRTSNKLVTFGLGGCGFYTRKSEVLSAPTLPVLCHFKLAGQKNYDIEVQGKLVYVQEIEVDQHRTFYQGIEFAEDQRELVRPIVEFLETLEKEKKIQYA